MMDYGTPTIFDIETTAIDDWHTLAGLTAIHCLVIRRGDHVYRYTSDGSHDGDIAQGVEFLSQQDVIVGHNALCFDIPAIQKMFPGWRPSGLVLDTKVLARLAFSDQKHDDFKMFIGKPVNYRKLIGSHSLEAWGLRLGFHKGDHGKQEDAWDHLSEEMLEYCVQDTLVTQKLFEHCCSHLTSPIAVTIEHEFQRICWDQECAGFAFDSDSATRLAMDLASQRESLRLKLEKSFPEKTVVMKRPAYWEVQGKRFPTKKAAMEEGYPPREIVAGPPTINHIPFNPDSRQQIAEELKARGWEPKEFTPGGQPKIDASILGTLKFDEAKDLTMYLTLGKRLTALSEGEEAWIDAVKDGRIHGRVNTIGTATHRCTHTSPNIAQVPATRAQFGTECRSLFIPGEGKILLGADASGLELRCLAHYLHPFDRGKYVDLVLNADIHTANQEAAGLDTRDQAKTFIYALIYGAGPQKIGEIVGGGSKDGKILMKRFTDRMPALKKLREAIKAKLKMRPYLQGLDGRRVPIRSQHSALNYLLQSAGAVVMKHGTVDAHARLRRISPTIQQVAHIHDEVQYEVDPQDAEACGLQFVEVFRELHESLNFKCPLDAEFKVGDSWAKTH